MVWLYAGIAGVVLGIVLLVVGVRGRRRGSEPRCAACGFDLSGVWKGVDGTVCPECGVELHHGTRRAGGVRTGTRRAVRPVVVVGVLLLLVGGGVGGVQGWSRATQFDWNTVKPAWMLVRTVESGADQLAVDASLTELLSRADSDRLDASMRLKLQAMVLDYHEDWAKPWTEPWAQLLGHYVMSGELSDAEMQRFMENAARVTARVRKRALPGVRAPIQLSMEYRTPVAMAELAFRFEKGYARVVGYEQPFAEFGSSHGPQMINLSYFGNRRSGQTWTFTGSHLLMTGTHEIEWLFAAGYQLVVPGTWQLDDGRRTLPTPESEWTGPRLDAVLGYSDGRLERLIAGRATLEVADDAVVWMADESPQIHEELKAMVSVRDLKVEVAATRADVTGSISVAGQPSVPIAFKVWLEDGDRRWQAGSLTMSVAANRWGSSFGFGMRSSAFRSEGGEWEWFSAGENPALLDVTEVAVVLEPALAVAASGTVDIDEVWAGTIVIKDVPIVQIRSDD